MDKAPNFSSGFPLPQVNVGTLSIGSRLNEINNRLYNLGILVAGYEYAIGEFLPEYTSANGQKTEYAGDSVSSESPSISSLLDTIAAKIANIEIVCANLDKHLAR